MGADGPRWVSRSSKPLRGTVGCHGWVRLPYSSAARSRSTGMPETGPLVRNDRTNVAELYLPPLYDPRMEHDACGVGFVANVGGEATHQLVEAGIQAVINVTHRGAVSADGKSGDGAGILSQIPQRLFARELTRLGFRLPEGWILGVGMVFLPQAERPKSSSIAIIEQAVER